MTGLYQKITDRRALRTLLRVAQETQGSLSARLSLEPQFHTKEYLLSSQNTLIAIFGSSNLTNEGLCSGGETDFIARVPRADATAKRIMSVFNKQWEHRAVSLRPEQIARYEKTRPEKPGPASYSKATLERILGATPSHCKAAPDVRSMRWWREGFDEIVEDQTKRILRAETDWDAKHYDWFSPGGPHPYRINDLIYLFDLVDMRLRLVTVEDAVYTKVGTPDGRHFVAYKPQFRQVKQFSPKLWSSLRSEGIFKKNACHRRKLGIQKAKRLMLLLQRN